jgi:hypothetical protein
MAYTEADLDRMINGILDEKKDCRDEMPYVCGMINTKHGRIRLFTVVKKIVLEQGQPDIEAILAQIEDAHDFKY